MRFFILLSLVLPVMSFGAMNYLPPKTITIDASVNNIPQNFSTSFPSKALSGLNGFSGIKVLSTLGCSIKINTSYGDVAPADNADSNLTFPAYTVSPGAFQDNLYVATAIYVRSDCSPAASITSGKLTIEAY